MSRAFPPGPRARPVVGNTLELRRDRLGFLIRLHETYGNVATVHLGRQPAFFFARPEAIEHILIDNADNFTKREVARRLRLLLGESLLLVDAFRTAIGNCCGCHREQTLFASDGEDHRERRQLVQPDFHRQRLESYRDVMVDETERMLARWEGEATVEIASEMQRLTLQIIGRTLFGLDLADRSDRLLGAFTTLLAFATKPLQPWQTLPLNARFTPYGQYVRAWRAVDDEVRDIIARNRDGPDGRGHLLARLVRERKEDGSPLTDSEIRDQVVSLMDAGATTTASALTWTLYLLSEHPDVRDRLRAKLDEVLEGRPPRVEDLANVPLLEWVLKESMRIYPPIWGDGRYANDDFELEGYRLPGGSFVLFSQWITHRLPELFREPDRFRPERFDPEQGDRHPRLAYFPFSGGAHTCLGGGFAMLEMQLVLATVLQRFAPTLVEGHPVVPETRSVTLHSKFGMPMRLEPARLPTRRAAITA